MPSNTNTRSKEENDGTANRLGETAEQDNNKVGRDLTFFQNLFNRDLPCYHGSTREAFTSESIKHKSYQESTKLWIIYCLGDYTQVEWESQYGNALDRGSNDPDFPKFLLALCAEFYLVGGLSEDVPYPENKNWVRLLDLFYIAIGILRCNRVIDGEEQVKRRKDATTRLGLVKSLEKSIPCQCLRRVKQDAKKNCVREGRCFGCMRIFPREQLKLCSRCRHNSYCGNVCQREHWPEHKEYCKKWAAGMHL